VAMNRIEVITSVERRRRWSAADKARLVAAMDEAGAVAVEIARDAGVDVSLLYRWRRQLAEGCERGRLLPFAGRRTALFPESLPLRRCGIQFVNRRNELTSWRSPRRIPIKVLSPQKSFTRGIIQR
jgi:transposase